MAFAVIAALVSGYYLRDAGYVVNIDQTGKREVRR
jgi:hypothetical protein